MKMNLMVKRNPMERIVYTMVNTKYDKVLEDKCNMVLVRNIDEIRNMPVKYIDRLETKNDICGFFEANLRWDSPIIDLSYETVEVPGYHPSIVYKGAGYKCNPGDIIITRDYQVFKVVKEFIKKPKERKKKVKYPRLPQMTDCRDYREVK